MYIHRIDIKWYIMMPFLLHMVRGFVCIKYMMNLFRTVRHQQISIIRSYFRHFFGSNIINIFRILRTEITAASLQRRNFAFIPSPQFQFETLIRLCLFFILLHFFLTRPEFHRQKRLTMRQTSANKLHPSRKNNVFTIEYQITGILLQRKIVP